MSLRVVCFADRSRVAGLLCLGLALLSATSPAFAQQGGSSLVNEDGVNAPCVGLGPGPQLERKCMEAYSNEGFLRADAVGYSGLILGTVGAQDGVVQAIAPGSPAQAAGFQVGDAVLMVDGRSVVPTAAELFTRETFGPRNQTVVLKVRHGDVERTVELIRAPATPANSPKVTGFLIATRPLIDWRGKYIPCVGAPGPAGMSGFALCVSLFDRYGYIRVADLGNTGIALDKSAKDTARVASVEAGSPAAAAGILPGDLLSTSGTADRSPAGPIAHMANGALFGKVGDKHRVTVHRAGGDQTVELALAANGR